MLPLLARLYHVFQSNASSPSQVVPQVQKELPPARASLTVTTNRATLVPSIYYASRNHLSHSFVTLERYMMTRLKTALPPVLRVEAAEVEAE